MKKIPYDLIKGIVVPLVTPVDERERIDTEGLKRLVNHVISGGVHGIFVLGTTGEFPRLAEREKQRAVETVAEAAKGRASLYMGVGECGTRRVRDMIRVAERAGADFIVATLPFYYKAEDEEEQYSFFRSLLDDTELPAVIYNIPETTGAGIGVDVIRRLLSHPQLAGIKDSGGDMEYFNALLRMKDEKKEWKVFCGAEKIAYDSLSAGADGLVPSIGNVFPRMTVALWDAAVNKDWEAARIIQEQFMDVNRFNFKIKSSLRGVIMRKKALEILGVCGSKVTEPCLYPDPALMPEFEAVVKKYFGIYERKA
jgi:4-hydroxy-tetrahydrodipicolinate synthase